MVRLARQAGFHHISASQHYLATPVQYMQPLPVLARVAAEAGEMTLGTGIMLLALQRPVDVAESVATLDVICASDHYPTASKIARGLRTSICSI